MRLSVFPYLSCIYFWARYYTIAGHIGNHQKCCQGNAWDGYKTTKNKMVVSCKGFELHIQKTFYWFSGSATTLSRHGLELCSWGLHFTEIEQTDAHVTFRNDDKEILMFYFMRNRLISEATLEVTCSSKSLRAHTKPRRKQQAADCPTGPFLLKTNAALCR